MAAELIANPAKLALFVEPIPLGLPSRRRWPK